MVNIAATISKLTAPLRRRVLLMVGRAVVLAVDDSSKCQTVQITALKGEVLDNVERITEYGFVSHPHSGAEAVLLAVGGNRANGVVIVAGDRRYRLTGLAAGEVALHDDQGQVIKLARGGIEITTDKPITVNAPKVVVNSDEIVLGGEDGSEQPIARIGDEVEVTSGSSAGRHKIVSGSDKVRAS